MNTYCKDTSLALAITLIWAGTLYGQVGKSGISGTVTDRSGSVVPNAKVEARDERTNLTWNAVTSQSGAYFIRNLPVGRFTVSVEAAGFQRTVIANVETEVDRVTSVDAQLTVGEVTQSVEVHAETELLTTTSGTVGNLVTTHEMESLPLNGRSWISLNYLTPSAVKFRGTSSATSNITASVAPGNFVVNGLRGGNNKFYIDGVSLENTEDQILGIIPPVDALQEFRTETANMSAEFMAGAGAVVSATTKSGGNEVHGAVWEYLRNDKLDARNFFDRQVAKLRRNQFGGIFGAPIRKNRTFVFGSYEGFRQVQATTLVGDYPTAAQRAGDLSTLPGRVVDPLNGQPFPGNVIPASRINPLSTSWLDKYIPLPNTAVPVGQGNFARAVPRPINYDTYIARLDHRFSDNISIFGRYIYTNTTSLQRFIAPLAFNRPQDQPNHNVAFNYTQTLGAGLVLEGRFGYQRWFHREPVGSDDNANMLEQLGVAGKPGFTDVADSQLAPPRISVTGFAQFGHGFFGRPREYYNDHFYYDGLLMMVRGSHSMRMGGSVIRSRADFPEIINPTGSWSYTGQFSGSPLGDYLLGYPRSVSTSIDLFSQNLVRTAGSLWFQDDWKATPKFTLNLGFRVDIDGRFATTNGRLSNLDLSKPPTAVLITPNNPAFPRPAGWPERLYDAPTFDPAPRFSFAYRLVGSTVIRGGYGIFWQPMGSDPPVNLSIQGPWIRSIGATFDITDLPTFDRSNPLRQSQATAAGGFGLQRDFKDAYVQEWNLTLEHTIGANLFSVGYLGNKGTHLITFAPPNLAPPGPGPIQPRRPYTNVGGIQWEESSRDANYNGLHVKAQRRFARGLAFTASYAFGKAINDGDGTYIESRSDVFQQPRNPKAERGLAEFDVRHSFTLSYDYQLPLGRGHAFFGNASGTLDKIVSGWQILGITRFLTGSPFTVTNSFDNLNNGGTGYPNVVCNPNLGGGRSHAQQISMFFNTACFATPPLYTFGNEGRNVVTGPGTQLWDISLQKETSLSERVKLEFRSEFFNIFNNVNFDYPNASYGTAQFGTIRGTSEPSRQIQFGLKLSF